MAQQAGTNVFGDLLGLFETEAPPLIEKIRKAIEVSDAPALKAAAHSLKGAAANLGARGMAASCAELERQGRDGELHGAGDLAQQLESEYARVCDALRSEALPDAKDEGGRRKDEASLSETPARDDAPVLDPRTVGELREMRSNGAPQVFVDLLGLLQSEAPPLIEKISVAIRSEDAPGLKAAAHSLKGAAANLGARALADACSELERQGRDGELAGAPALLEVVQTQYRRVHNALSEEAGVVP